MNKIPLTLLVEPLAVPSSEESPKLTALPSEANLTEVIGMAFDTCDPKHIPLTGDENAPKL